MNINLKKEIDYVLEHYLDADSYKFSKDMEYYKVIVDRIPSLLAIYLDSDNYLYKGSCGKGSKSNCPYVMIANKFVTSSPQEGFYVDIIFKSDMSGFYIAIDQSIVSIRDRYGNKKAQELSIKCSDYFRSLITNDYGFKEVSIIADVRKGSLEEGYRNSKVLGKYYEKGKYSNEELLSDIQNLVKVYDEIVGKLNGRSYDQIIDEISYGDGNMNSADVLDELINKYVADAPKYIPDELYKWKAIKNFKTSWIDDCSESQFADMLANSLRGAYNILNSQYYYAGKMICEFAFKEPKTVKEMFTNLFDESKDLYQRIKDFQSKCDELLKKYNPDKKHFQDAHAISTYLGFMYPNKYYLYKAQVDKRALKLLGHKINDSDKIKELLNYYNLCDELRVKLDNYEDVKKLIDSMLTDESYKDDDYHILTWDVLFYIGNYCCDEDKNVNNKVWLYSPGENAAFWDDCINENAIFIGWDLLGNLSEYADEDEVYNALKEKYGSSNPKNDKCACYDFANTIKVGDTVIVKSGDYKLLGYGYITSDYQYDESRERFKHKRSVEWAKIGEWINSSGTKNARKTLTEISQYPGYPEELLNIINGVDNMNSNVTEWIVPANSSLFDLKGCLNRDGYVDWVQHCKYRIGDVIYLYNTAPESAIRFVATVEKVDIPYAEKTNNLQFCLNGEFGDKDSLYVRFRSSQEVEENSLTYEILSKHGLKGNLQSARRVPDELSRYIHFVIDNQELRSMNKIYYGGPGCGKSFYVKNQFCSGAGTFIRTTFYPDYTNSDFVGQLIPKYDHETGKLIYDIQAGPFTKALELALNSNNKNKNIYLIIEEINRGNAAAIFGDIFQLLDRNKIGESEFTISNYVIEQYIYNTLGIDLENKVYIPSNLSIIATMNTSDQNVYTLDSAFKRRWKMEYISNKFGVNEESKLYDDEIGEMVVPIRNLNITWKEFISAINKAIIEEDAFGINSEDKQLGKYFVGTSDLISSETYETNNFDDAAKRFAEKVLMYIWEDVSKLRRTDWFRDDIKTFETLLDEYIVSGVNVFSANIKSRLSSDFDEEREEEAI